MEIANIIEKLFWERIQSLGLSLPPATKPGGNYESVIVRHKVAYIAIQFPINDGNFYYQGRLGENISTEEGYKAMQMCGLNIISQVHHKIGLNKILGFNHIDAYFQANSSWDEAPIVVNGASDVLVQTLEDAGRHTRAIMGIERLPRNFSVALSASVTLL